MFTISPMSSPFHPDPPPRWLHDLAGAYHAIIRRALVIDYVHCTLSEWMEEAEKWDEIASLHGMEGLPTHGLPYGGGVSLLPVPDRTLTSAEKFAILSAIHDVCWKGEKINPWAIAECRLSVE